MEVLKIFPWPSVQTFNFFIRIHFCQTDNFSLSLLYKPTHTHLNNYECISYILLYIIIIIFYWIHVYTACFFCFALFVFFYSFSTLCGLFTAEIYLEFYEITYITLYFPTVHHLTHYRFICIFVGYLNQSIFWIVRGCL